MNKKNKYEGDFKNGSMDGFGKYTFSNGNDLFKINPPHWKK